MTTPRSVRRPLLVVTALLAAAGTTLAAVPSADADQSLRFSTVKVSANSTEIDEGPAGSSAGDGEIFVDDVQRRGRSIGNQAGACTLALVSKARLVSLCSTTISLPAGSLTTQGSFDENPSEGPAGLRWAVTGGTGRYAGAAGEAVGSFRPSSDIVDWEIRLR